MLKASLKSVLARRARLALSAFAVVLGVAFVAGSLIFTDTLGRAFDEITAGAIPDVSVQQHRSVDDFANVTAATLPLATVDQVRRVEGVARADATISASGVYVLDRAGKVIGTAGAPALGMNYLDAPALRGGRGLVVRDGRAPQAAGEVMIDPGSAKKGRYALGDTVRIVYASTATPVEATLVGTGTWGGEATAGASYVIFDTATAQRLFIGDAQAISGIWVTLAPGQDRAAVAHRIAPLLPTGWEAQDGQVVADQINAMVRQNLSFMTTFLLVFAGIALLVGSFIIVNTFSIIIAQRLKELALLRALGASRGQILRSVLVEGLVVALIGSAAGLGLGVALAYGIHMLFAAIGFDTGTTSLSVGWHTVLVSTAVGVIVTLLAAYLPARRAARIAPVAALVDEPELPRGASGRRLVVGLLAIVAGAVAMMLGLWGDFSPTLLWLGGGMLAVVLGAAGTSPIIGRPLVWLLGRAYRAAFGTVGQLAELNAVRNPRRTAATASALMIGLALVATMATLGESAKTSVDRAIRQDLRADFIIQSVSYEPFSPTVGDAVARIDGVARIDRYRGAVATVRGEQHRIGSMEPSSFNQVFAQTVTAGSLRDFTGHALMLSEQAATSAGLHAGEHVTVDLNGHRFDLLVALVYARGNGADVDWVATPAVFADAQLAALDALVTVTLRPGADPAAVGRALDSVTRDLPMLTAKDQGAYAQGQLDMIDQMLVFIYALLGLAVVIAILGIINTLVLSVIERTREIGLLRAVGLARSQLRRMIALESVIIALLGATMGVGLGIAFGAVLQHSLADEGLTELVIPGGRLLAFVAVAGLVGVLAALLPARRAARLHVLDAIATA